MAYGKILADKIQSSSGKISTTGELSSELESIARSLNVSDTAVIYSTDTTTVLDNVSYIYDATAQTTYGMPEGISAGETIVSLSGVALTTSLDSYTLSPVLPRMQPVFAYVSIMKASKPLAIDGSLISLTDGMTISTQGYYNGWAASKDQVGGATYDVTTLAKVRAAKGDGAWVPDEFGDHTAGNGLVLMIRTGVEIDICTYGAATDIADNSGALQAVADTNKQSMYVPEGVFPFSTGIIFGDLTATGANIIAMGIRGAGQKSNLDYTGTLGDALTWDVALSTATTYSSPKLESFLLTNSGTGKRGIVMSGVNYGIINFLQVKQFSDAQMELGAFGGSSGGLWGSISDILLEGGKIGLYMQDANAWSINKLKCFSQSEIGFDCVNASTVITGFSGVPLAAAASYNAIRTNGSTTILGFEFENGGGATINGYLIEVEQGWTRALSISTRSISSSAVIGSTSGNGKFLVDPTLVSSEQTAPDEFISTVNAAIEHQCSDSADLVVASTGLSQNSLNTKAQRSLETSLTPGVNNAYSGRVNMWTPTHLTVSRNFTPEIRGIKVVASGLASTALVEVLLMDASTTGAAVNTSLLAKTVSNGTQYFSYEEMMDLLDYNGIIFRVQVRSSIPEATFTGALDITLIYRND